MALTIGRRGAPALCILGRPSSMGVTASVLYMNMLFGQCGRLQSTVDLT